METEEKKITGRVIVMVLGILALTAIVILAILRDRIVNYPQYQIQATGRGTVKIIPDQATITLAVNSNGETAADVYRDNTQRSNAVITKLQSLGIAKEDLGTAAYSLTPQYDYNKGTAVRVGYLATNQIVVKLKGIDKNPDQLGQVLDQATKAGADSVVSIIYSLQDAETVKQQARLKAIADAKGRATEIAQAIGVSLGDVVGWWENPISVPGQPVPFYDAKGGAGVGGDTALTILPNQQEIIIEVNLSYRLN